MVEKVKNSKKTTDNITVEVITEEKHLSTEELEKEYERIFYEKKAAEIEARLRKEIYAEVEEKKKKDAEGPINFDEDKAEKIRLRERTPIKVRFNYHEVPGGTTNIAIRRHRKDGIEKFELKDGEERELPLGVCKHINESCWYPVMTNALDKNGISLPLIGRKVQRMSVTPLQEGYSVELLTAGETHIKAPDQLSM